MKELLSLIFRSQSKTQNEFLKKRVRDFKPTSEEVSGFKFKYNSRHAWMEVGNGKPLIFSPGLFGSYRNFYKIAQGLSGSYKTYVPFLPFYDLPLKECNVKNLGIYLKSFSTDLGLNNVIIAGNSMGGGASLHYTLLEPSNVEKVILFASSGLSFIPMRNGLLKTKDREYIKLILKDIFYDSSNLTEAEIDEVFKLIQNKEQLLRCLSFTRSTKKDLLHEELPLIKQPTLIIWGANDNVTSKDFAFQFHSLLVNSKLAVIPECGHVPCYEKPDECLREIRSFL